VCVRQINKSENFLLARVTPNKNRKTLTSGGGKKCNLIAKHTHTHRYTRTHTKGCCAVAVVVFSAWGFPWVGKWGANLSALGVRAPCDIIYVSITFETH